MKWFFTFMIFLAVTSFSADLVSKVIDASKLSKTLSESEEEPSDEPSSEEEGDTEEKIKLREFEWINFSVAEANDLLVAGYKLFFLISTTNIPEQHSTSVPFSPPEMS